MLLLLRRSSSSFRQLSSPSTLEMSLSLKEAQRRLTSLFRLISLEILWLSRFRAVIWSKFRDTSISKMYIILKMLIILIHNCHIIIIMHPGGSIFLTLKMHLCNHSFMRKPTCLWLTFAVQSGSRSRLRPQGAGLSRHRRWAVDSRLRLRGRSLLVHE